MKRSIPQVTCDRCKHTQKGDSKYIDVESLKQGTWFAGVAKAFGWRDLCPRCYKRAQYLINQLRLRREDEEGTKECAFDEVVIRELKG